MSMFEAIRTHLQGSVPYAAYTGVEIVEVGAGSAQARLPRRADVENHIQTMHAGAIFTLGEAASGAAMAGLLSEHIFAIRPVAASATIDYLKTGKSDLVADARTNVSASDAQRALLADGKIEFVVNVDITDADGNAIARMVVNWHVRKTG